MTQEVLTREDEQHFIDLINIGLSKPDAGHITGLTHEGLLIRSRFDLAAEGDWTAASEHLSLGTALQSDGKPISALAHFRSAFAYTAPAVATLLNAAALFMNSGRQQTAQAILVTMLENGCDQAEIRLHLAHAQWADGKSTEALQSCRILIDQHSQYLPGIETALMMHNEKGDPFHAVAASLRYISDANGSEISHNLILLTVKSIVKLGLPIDPVLARRLREATEISGGSSALSIAQQMIEMHHIAPRRLSAALESEKSKEVTYSGSDLLDYEALKQYFYSSPPITLYSDDDNGIRNIFGLEFRAASFFKDVCVPAGLGVAFRSKNSAYLEERMKFTDSARAIQIDAVRNGCVQLRSPFGGVEVSSTSIVLDFNPSQRTYGSVIAYYFMSPNPWFAIFASEDHWPIALFEPRQNCVVVRARFQEYARYLQDMVGDLKAILAFDVGETRKYLASNRDRIGNKPYLLVGQLDFLSTYVFSALQGALHLAKAGLSNKIKVVKVMAPELIGSIARLIPEINAAGMIERWSPKDVIELNHALWRANSYAVRVTGGYVTQDLAGRIVDFAHEHATPEWMTIVKDLNAAHFPIIFLSLRAHNRRWLVSGQKIASLFNEISEKYPNMALIIDGFSVTAGSSPKTTTVDELALFQSIEGNLRADIRVVHSSGKTIADGIIAAFYSHVHLSGQGTSTTKSVLIAGKPGVVIGPRNFGWDARAYRDPCPELITPWEETVDSNAVDLQCDFTLDERVVFSGLCDVIEKCRPVYSDD
ncbi:hypothetical protein [Methylobacterium sp. SI9]|uniref:hypothetical protein n=1 Tax=Methylobacterium guangdongense TaxID=3138811 RepID=UPI00313D02BB